MKERREAACDRARRDERIFVRLFSLKDFISADSYFLYRSFGSEADTSRIAAELMRRGKTVFYPRVCKADMELVRWTEGQEFVRNRWGIEEPVGRAEKIKPAVCILPFLAADRQFHRLGYGGGFYDRFLAESPGIRKVGIGYAFQVFDRIPFESFDVALDVVVTDSETLLRNMTEDV